MQNPKNNTKSCFAFLFSFCVDVVTGRHNKILLIVISLRKGLQIFSSSAAMLTYGNHHTVHPGALALVQIFFGRGDAFL